MEKKLEIYFDDLNDQAKKRYLEFQGVEDPSELNADIFPIFVIESEESDGISNG